MKFEDLRIKNYGKWDLFLNKDQNPFIGRAYAWLNREETGGLAALKAEEVEQLFYSILPAFERAVSGLFQPVRFNHAEFGNRTPQTHMHIVPRYDKMISFGGFLFTDPDHTQNYSSFNGIPVLDKLTLMIRDSIREAL